MLENFLNQLRENPRLRWGVAMIVGLFWLYAILLLRETLQQQEQQHRASAQSLSRLRTQLTQTEWISRVVPAKTLSVQLEGRLWQAPTSGLAQAAFQDALNSAMVKAGVTHSQISVIVVDELETNTPNQNQDSATTTPADLWKVKAKLGFDFNAAALLNFMSQIESHDKQITVAALKADKEPLNHVEVELVGYFQKQTSAASRTQKELVPL